MGKTTWIVASALLGGCTGSGIVPDVEPPPPMEREDAEPWQANRLYPGPCTLVVDSGIDGVAELIEHARYDDDDRQVLLEYDTFANGVIDYRQTTQVENAGLRLVVETDSHGNGSVDFREVSELDAWGDEVRRQRDRNGDGTFDWQLDLAFDDDRHLVSESLDSNGDGHSNSGKQFRYTGSTLELAIILDANGDPSAVTRYVYGDMTMTELFDANADDTVDRSIHTSFAANGLPASVIVDQDDDGIDDSITTLEYSGLLLATRSIDDNADGQLDRVENFKHDWLGRQTSYTMTTSGGGPELILTTRYDDDEHLTIEELDRDADGEVDAIETARRDEFGNILILERDTTGNGVANVTYSYGYECF